MAFDPVTSSVTVVRVKSQRDPVACHLSRPCIGNRYLVDGVESFIRIYLAHRRLEISHGPKPQCIHTHARAHLAPGSRLPAAYLTKKLCIVPLVQSLLVNMSAGHEGKTKNSKEARGCEHPRFSDVNWST